MANRTRVIISSNGLGANVRHYARGYLTDTQIAHLVKLGFRIDNAETPAIHRDSLQLVDAIIAATDAEDISTHSAS